MVGYQAVFLRMMLDDSGRRLLVHQLYGRQRTQLKKRGWLRCFFSVRVVTKDICGGRCCRKSSSDISRSDAAAHVSLFDETAYAATVLSGFRVLLHLDVQRRIRSLFMWWNLRPLDRFVVIETLVSVLSFRRAGKGLHPRGIGTNGARGFRLHRRKKISKALIAKKKCQRL